MKEHPLLLGPRSNVQFQIYTEQIGFYKEILDWQGTFEAGYQQNQYTYFGAGRVSISFFQI